MKRAILWLFALCMLAGLGWAAWRLYDERSFVSTPYGEGVRTVVVHAGSGPHALAKLLADARIVSDETRFYTYLRWFRRGNQAKAGEYEFDGPLVPDEVLGKLVRGEVKLHRFTVPEGLRVDEVAPLVAATGICTAADFLRIARDPASTKKFGVPGPSMEGYLFPDTYSVPRSIGCPGIVSAMVARFQHAWQKAQAQRQPSVKLSEPEAITLASIVEKETGVAGDRAHVSCVYTNRLRRGMPLQADPTVIYAILLSNDFKWDGNIHKKDLSLKHPYNTYVNRGLPPGPIANPGEKAMQAALHPLACHDLYFVSRNDGTTAFCPDLKCHNKNVQKFQIEYFKHRKG
jgi:UPF0755 protein